MSSGQQSDNSWQNADFRAVKLERPHVEVTHTDDGIIYVSKPSHCPHTAHASPSA